MNVEQRSGIVGESAALKRHVFGIKNVDQSEFSIVIEQTVPEGDIFTVGNSHDVIGAPEDAGVGHRHVGNVVKPQPFCPAAVHPNFSRNARVAKLNAKLKINYHNIRYVAIINFFVFHGPQARHVRLGLDTASSMPAYVLVSSVLFQHRHAIQRSCESDNCRFASTDGSMA